MMTFSGRPADAAQHTEINVPVEIPFRAEKAHTNPFIDVTLDVEFVDPEGRIKIVPAF